MIPFIRNASNSQTHRLVVVKGFVVVVVGITR